MADSKVVIQPTFSLPILPLRNLVPLPRGVIPVRVARDFSAAAVKVAMERYDGRVFVVAQKNSKTKAPVGRDVFKVGIVAKIIQTSIDKDGTTKALLESEMRCRMIELEKVDDFLIGHLEEFPVLPCKSQAQGDALLRSMRESFTQYIGLNDRVSADLIKLVNTLSDVNAVADALAMHVNMSMEMRQQLLEAPTLKNYVVKVCTATENEIEILKAEKSIRKRVQSQVEKNHKDYYLNEQVRAIYKELGREDSMKEIESFKEKAEELGLSDEAHEKLLGECKRMEQMQPMSPEASVSRSYIEWLLALPWHKKSRDRHSLSAAEKILEASHAAMDKAKERILEFIAAKKYAKEKLESSPIICLVGPPGVGKTSLAKSIAEALGRNFVRISLGGLRDEAEIRGHRRTYIGSMPGKIIHAMRKSGVVNPVILIDEIDKMAMDFRGDPASALLEVLDPEQNNAFVDHYLEVGYDISNAIFIATSNVYENIPAPLLDRMEMISLPGYTEDEKIKIAQKFLLPKLLKEHNLTATQVKIDEKILRQVINDYTREAGVRQLSRVISKLIRKSIQKILKKEAKNVVVVTEWLDEWLGYNKYKPSLEKGKESIGVSIGLAWTEVGGDVLEVEVSSVKGKGALTITGQLGEVMQESAQASLSYIRSHAKSMNLDEDFYSSVDLHIHIPEGAIPKDGPSAGITISTALVSELLQIPIDKTVAMTGEITLRGRVLPVGGLKEKILAAVRLGLKKVILPKDNEGDVKEFIKDIDGLIELAYVSKMEEVLKIALIKDPFEPKKKLAAKKVPAKKKSKKVTKVAKKLKSSRA